MVCVWCDDHGRNEETNEQKERKAKEHLTVRPKVSFMFHAVPCQDLPQNYTALPSGTLDGMGNNYATRPIDLI